MNQFVSYKISFFNIFLSILIVILHSNCKNTLGWENDGSLFGEVLVIMSQILTMIGHLAVPTFFIISGYLFYRNISQVQVTFVKIKKRLKTLLVPYLLWNTFFVLLFWIILNTFLAKYMHMSNNLQTVGEMLSAIVDSKLTPLWFIKDLMIFVLLSPIIYLLSKYFYLLITLILGIIIYVINNTDVDYFNFIYWLPMYFIGILMTKPQLRCFFESEKNIGWLSWIVLFLFLCVLLGVGIKSNFLYIYRILAPLLIWHLSTKLLKMTHLKKRSYWKYSFFIYCTHFFVINIIQKILFIGLGNSNFSYLCIYLSTPLIVLVVCIFIAKLMEQYTNSLYKILTGNR